MIGTLGTAIFVEDTTVGCDKKLLQNCLKLLILAAGTYRLYGLHVKINEISCTYFVFLAREGSFMILKFMTSVLWFNPIRI